MRVETERSLVRTAIALKRYKGQHQKLPETLEALVPEFLPSVPIDFMDGKPLRYVIKEGAPILYTVGEDGVDDGGDESPMDGKSSVLNVWNRRDFVWPIETLH